MNEKNSKTADIGEMKEIIHKHPKEMSYYGRNTVFHVYHSLLKSS